MKTNLSLRTRLLHCWLIFILVLLQINCSKHINQIYIDGQFTDWKQLSPVYQDKTGDQQPGRPDLGKLWMTNDADYLYFRVEVGAVINLQNNNELTMFLDTDDNALTGKQIYGIGADLIYEFGKREGVFYSKSDTAHVSHFSIGLVTFPTVTSTQFEIAVKRASMPDNKSSLFPGKSIRFLIMDKIDGGDVLPDKPGGVKYTFREEVPLPQTPVSIKKDDPTCPR